MGLPLLPPELPPAQTLGQGRSTNHQQPTPATVTMPVSIKTFTSKDILPSPALRMRKAVAGKAKNWNR